MALAPVPPVAFQQLGLWGMQGDVRRESKAREMSLWWCSFCRWTQTMGKGEAPTWPPWTCPEDALNRVPEQPLRHWILTLPSPWRMGLAVDRQGLHRVRRLFVDEVFAWLDRRCGTPLRQNLARAGAMVVVHRCGRDLEPNVHFHALVLDGVYAADSSDEVSRPLFKAMGDPPGFDELRGLSRRIAARLAKLRPPRVPLLPQRPQEQASRTRVQHEHPATKARIRAWSGSDSAGVRVRVGALVETRDVALRLARYVLRPPFDARYFEARRGTQGSSRVIRQNLQRPLGGGQSHLDWSMQALTPRLRLACPPRGRAELTYHGVLAPAAALHQRLRARQLSLLEPGVMQRVKPGKARVLDPNTSAPRVVLCSRCGLPMEPRPGQTAACAHAPLDPSPSSRGRGGDGGG